MQLAKEENKRIDFIIGIERSGTSLLNKVFNNHPKIHGIPEATFLVFFLHRYRHRTKFLPSDIELIFKQIHYYHFSNPWVGWEFDVLKVKNEILELVNNNSLSYITLCKIIYSKFKVIGLDKNEAVCYLDKNPAYTIYVNKIKKSLPDARFIYLVRDYRGNILSKKQIADFKSTDVAFNAMRWRLFNKIAWKFYLKNKKDVFYLTYEDFVLKTDIYVTEITKHLGLNTDFDWKNDKVKFDTDPGKYNLSEKYRENFETKYNNLNKEINNNRTAAWKTQLTQEEIKVCDTICYPFAKRFGMEPHFKLNAAQRLSIKLKYMIPIVRAHLDVYKDILLYYVSPKLKIDRLEKSYRKLDLIRTKIN